MKQTTAEELLRLSNDALEDLGIKASRHIIKHYSRGGRVGIVNADEQTEEVEIPNFFLFVNLKLWIIK